MNLPIIFLCLLFGAVIGYEFGKYQATKRIQEALNKLAENIKEEAQRKKEQQEESWKNFRETLSQIAKDIAEQNKQEEAPKPVRKRKPKIEEPKEEPKDD